MREIHARTHTDTKYIFLELNTQSMFTKWLFSLHFVQYTVQSILGMLHTKQQNKTYVNEFMRVFYSYIQSTSFHFISTLNAKNTSNGRIFPSFRLVLYDLNHFVHKHNMLARCVRERARKLVYGSNFRECSFYNISVSFMFVRTCMRVREFLRLSAQEFVHESDAIWRIWHSWWNRKSSWYSRA